MRMFAAMIVVFALHCFGASAAPPCAAPTHRQFDFWIGDWTVSRTDSTMSTTTMTLRTLSRAGHAGLAWPGALGSGADIVVGPGVGDIPIVLDACQ